METILSSVIISIIGFVGVYITAKSSVKASLESKEKQHQMDIDLENRKKKLELYQKWFDIIKLTFNDPGSKELEPKAIDFYQDSMFYAPKGIIESILDFKNSSHNENATQGDILFKSENILLKMREDLNLSNNGLNKGDLVRLIMSDPKEIDKIIENNKKVK